MRDLLLFIAIGVAAYLAYDDYSKRAALKSAQQEIQRLSSGSKDQSQSYAEQTPQHPIRARPYVPPAPSQPPAWFQERLNEGAALDGSRRHRSTESTPHR